MRRARLRMKKIAGGGYVRTTRGGGIIPNGRIGDFLRGAMNFVDTRAGPQLAEGADLLRQSLGKVVESTPADIFDAINKRLSGLKLTSKSGGAIRSIR